MVAFYNQGDQDIYNSGQHFIPQEKYRLDYKAPVQGGGQDASTPSFGIPYTNAFTNSGGGGGGGGGGSSYGLPGDFQQAVNARQNRLNNPSDTFLGFNTMKDQQLTGADAGEYFGSGTAIPQEQTMMGKVQSFLSPQSADQIMTDGYQEPRFQPGIIGTMLGKFDNYRNLPQTDQAFIAQNMGYTGPTVFGENSSGLGKDPFGINVRSAFGNYGEYVGKTATNLEQALKDAEEKYGGKTKKYMDMTKLMRTKLDFYRNKVKEREQIQADKKAADLKAFEDQKATSGITSGANDGRYENINDRDRGGQGAFKEDKTSMKSAGRSYQDSHGNVGYSRGRKDGGRIGYFFGGRAGFKNGGLASIL